MFFLLFFFPTVFSLSLLSQKLSLSNDFLTTSIGIGTPAQYFDLALDLDESKLVVMDKQTLNDKIDYQYDHLKALYDPMLV